MQIELHHTESNLMNAKLFSASAAVAGFLLLPLTAQAQTTFTDNAGNYSGSYSSAGGGVPGFGAFSVTTIGPSANTFLGSASESEGNNGTPSPGTIDTNGKSFGTYANVAATSTVSVSRNFSVPTQASGLDVAGDSFSLNFVTGYNDGNAAGTNGPGDGSGNSGVSLLTAGGTVGTFQYLSNDQYLFNGQQVTKASGAKQDYTTGAFSLLYTLTSPTAYTLTVNGPFQFTGTGTLTSPVTGFQVQQHNSGGGGADHNAYFNNLSVTAMNPASAAPEPSQIGVLAIICLGVLALAARKRMVKA